MKKKEKTREERFKEIYGEHLDAAFKIGIVIGKGMMRKKDKARSEAFEKIFRGQLRPGLTLALKKAGILPLK
jgi:hypothetical protein